MEQRIFKCPNCGAPAKGDTCEYCGTPFNSAYGNSDNIILRINGKEVAQCYLSSVRYEDCPSYITGRDVYGRMVSPTVAIKRIFTLVEK